MSVEFFERNDPSSLIFRMEFDDIVLQNDWGALDHGSARHADEVFARAKLRLTTAGKSAQGKENRWWNHEAKAIASRGDIPLLRMLLAYLLQKEVVGLRV